MFFRIFALWPILIVQHIWSSGERPDHPPPYACLVEYSGQRLGSVGVELLLFNELGGCQQVDKLSYFDKPVQSTMEAKPKYEDEIRWAVSGYPLVINSLPVTLEMTTRNVSDFRHVWRLPKLGNSLVQHLVRISTMKDAHKKIEFYFGFDEIQKNEILSWQHAVKCSRCRWSLL